jgi:flagellar basal body-associated protein FliL
MYLTPYQKKQLTTVIILVLGIPLTIFGMYKAVQWFSSAGADTQPKNVIVANVTTNSITKWLRTGIYNR